MLISNSHRFIFFHIGKTGGMSIREALRPLCEEPDKFKMRRPPASIDGRDNPMHAVWETLLLHAKAKDAQKELAPSVFNEYFKFAFVRNPWDLQVSMYHFILREPFAAKHDEVKALGSFEAFIEWVAVTPDPYPRGITKLQRDMIAGTEGNLVMDFIGRYESLDRDFNSVTKSLKIDAALSHLNRSSHSDYRTYYNDRSKKLVAENFGPDIELFGYCFGGCQQ